jgi:hypothetical protein
MKPIFRINTPDDINDLVQFWNDNGGWDTIDRNEWENRFHNTPYGPCPIVIAADSETNQILAHFIFIPSMIFFRGSLLKTLRPFAPVVSKQIRSALGLLTLMEYIYKMYKYAVKYFTKLDVALFYMLPDPRWSKAFQILPNVQTARFPLWSLKLSEQVFIDLPAGYKHETLQPDDPRIDALWEKSSILYGCGLVRDSHTLPWKLSHKKYGVFGISQQGRLSGLCVSFFRREDRQWLICDLLAEDTEMIKLLLKTAAAEAWLHRLSLEEDEHDRVGKVAILATPFLQPVIKELGFEKDKYDFPAVIQILNPALPKKELRPENWYVSAHD